MLEAENIFQFKLTLNGALGLIFPVEDDANPFGSTVPTYRQA